MNETSIFKEVGGEPATDNTGPLLWYQGPATWTNPEEKKGWWKIENGELQFAPPAKKDFWRKTYYEPLLVKDDGSFLYFTLPETQLPATIETSFSLTPKSQFDQAGIIIRLDKDHWIKTGIEVVDDKPRLSCVVTNGFSDWSTQNWPVPSVKIRVHLLSRHGGSFVIEAAPIGTDDWSFIRIAHMNVDFSHPILDGNPITQAAFEGPNAPLGTLMLGIFAACPVDQVGMVATFDHLSFRLGTNFEHDA